MFTGLVEKTGTVEAIRKQSAGLELRIACDYGDLLEGESISVNGACLTVREASKGSFTVAAVVTTLERTCLALWKVGRRVNLERAMRLQDRFGGHFLQGHVDCVGVVAAREQRGDAVVITVSVPGEIWRLMVPLGSVAVDGVSLTVNAIPSPGSVEVSLIEYTLSHTSLADLAVGDEVHVEADIIGKYVNRLLEGYRGN